MRYLGMLIGLALVAAAGPSRSNGEVAAERSADSVFEPYAKHHDTRFGHDHFYPDRGAIVRDLPKEAMVVNYAGLTFHFHDGIWYEPRGPAYMVVAPPIGLLVPSLPSFATLLARNGQTYIYCNDTYYRPRPDLNSYEVTNDPSEPTFQVAADSAPNTNPSPAGSGVAALAGSASAASSPVTVATALPETAQVSAPMPLPAESATPAPVVAPTVSAPAVLTAPTVTAVPGAALDSSPVQPRSAAKVFLYPRSGQSADQQARDRYECYRFAVAQTGFDPMRPVSGASSSDYDRAQAACFEGRGYTVR